MSEAERIRETLFSAVDQRGRRIEDYITHVNINEFQSREELEHPHDVPKPRVLILAAKNNGQVNVHKGRVNAEHVYQIGRSWPLDDLNALESVGNRGLVAVFGKPYYWGFESTKDKVNFVRQLNHIYKTYKQQPIPKLIGFDNPIWRPIFGTGAYAPPPHSTAASLGSDPGWEALPVSPNQPRQHGAQGFRASVASIPGVPAPAPTSSRYREGHDLVPTKSMRRQQTIKAIRDHTLDNSRQRANQSPQLSQNSAGQSPPLPQNQFTTPPLAQGAFPQRKNSDAPYPASPLSGFASPGGGQRSPHLSQTGSIPRGPQSQYQQNQMYQNQPPRNMRSQTQRVPNQRIPPGAPMGMDGRRPSNSQPPVFGSHENISRSHTLPSQHQDHMARTNTLPPTHSRAAQEIRNSSESLTHLPMHRGNSRMASQTPEPVARNQTLSPQSRHGSVPSVHGYSQAPNQHSSQVPNMNQQLPQVLPSASVPTVPSHTPPAPPPSQPAPPPPTDTSEPSRSRRSSYISDVQDDMPIPERSRSRSNSLAVAGAPLEPDQLGDHGEPPLPALPIESHDQPTAAQPETIVPPNAEIHKRQSTMSVETMSEFVDAQSPSKNNRRSSVKSFASGHTRRGSNGQDTIARAPHIDPAAASHRFSMRSNHSFITEEPSTILEEPDLQAEDNTVMRDMPTSPRREKLMKRMSPLKFDARNAHRTKTWSQTHSRNISNVSAGSILSNGEDVGEAAYRDLNAVLSQLQYNGVEETADIEKSIVYKINQVNESQVESIVTLEGKLSELDALIAGTIDECKNLDGALATIAVQLSTIGGQISHIEGEGEGSQVIEMNEKLLINELENLLTTAHLPKQVLDYVYKADFEPSHLAQLESNLSELYKSFTTLHSKNSSSLEAAREQEESVTSATDYFNREFAAFFKTQLSKILKSSPSVLKGGLQRVDKDILGQLFQYAGIIVFVENTNRSIYNRMVENYSFTLKGYYDDSVPSFMKSWRQGLESQLSKRKRFTFQSETSKPEEKQDASQVKRGRTIKQVAQQAHLMNKHDEKQTHKLLNSSEFELPSSVLHTTFASFDTLLSAYTENFAAQQQVLVDLFHLSSHGSGSNYDVYIHRFPLERRYQEQSRYSAAGSTPRVNEVESSRKVAQKVYQRMAQMLIQFESQTQILADLLAKNCILEMIYMIAYLEQKIALLANTNQEYCVAVLSRFRESLESKWKSFVEEQSRIILSTHLSTVKRIGVLPITSRFSTFTKITENALNEASKSVKDSFFPRTRELVDSSYNQLFRAVKQAFERSHHVGTSTITSITTNSKDEDKEALNYHVNMIENLNVIINGMLPLEGSDQIEKLLSQIRLRYREELTLYIRDVEQRPLGRLLEFSNDKAQPKFKSSHFKKVVSSYDGKEMRKNVEALRKRVEKHFGDEEADPVLVGKVWKAITAEFEGIFSRIQNYARAHDAENYLPVTKQDISNIMKAFQTMSQYNN